MSETGTEASTFSKAMSGKFLPHNSKPFQSEIDIVDDDFLSNLSMYDGHHKFFTNVFVFI